MFGKDVRHSVGQHFNYRSKEVDSPNEPLFICVEMSAWDWPLITPEHSPRHPPEALGEGSRPAP